MAIFHTYMVNCKISKPVRASSGFVCIGLIQFRQPGFFVGASRRQSSRWLMRRWFQSFPSDGGWKQEWKNQVGSIWMHYCYHLFIPFLQTSQCFQVLLDNKPPTYRKIIKKKQENNWKHLVFSCHSDSPSAPSVLCQKPLQLGPCTARLQRMMSEKLQTSNFQFSFLEKMSPFKTYIQRTRVYACLASSLKPTRSPADHISTYGGVSRCLDEYSIFWGLHNERSDRPTAICDGVSKVLFLILLLNRIYFLDTCCKWKKVHL